MPCSRGDRIEKLYNVNDECQYNAVDYLHNRSRPSCNCVNRAIFFLIELLVVLTFQRDLQRTVEGEIVTKKSSQVSVSYDVADLLKSKKS